MQRLSRLDAPGTLHHIMVPGIERRRIVDDDTDRNDFIQRMGEPSADTKTIIYDRAPMINHATFSYAALKLVFPESCVNF